MTDLYLERRIFPSCPTLLKAMVWHLNFVCPLVWWQINFKFKNTMRLNFPLCVLLTCIYLFEKCRIGRYAGDIPDKNHPGCRAQKKRKKAGYDSNCNVTYHRMMGFNKNFKNVLPRKKSICCPVTKSQSSCSKKCSTGRCSGACEHTEWTSCFLATILADERYLK